MTSSQRKILIYGLVVIMLSCAIALAFTGVDGMAYAAATSYTSVYEDLSKDASFDLSNYPAIPGDTSMEIVQIAEGSDGELFLYVYQPAAATQPLTATSISMAQSEAEPTFWIYWLQLVNREGVFAKYVLEDFKVRNDVVRIYNIAALYRSWDSKIDGERDDDNIMDSYAYSVRQLWKASGAGDDVSYTMRYRDVVIVEHQWVGSLRFNDGISWLYPVAQGKTDVHFVGFSTDHKIDELLEIDITYLSQLRCHDAYGGMDSPQLLDTNGTYAEVETVSKTIHSDDEEQSNPADGLWGKKHTWQNISTKDEFVSAQNLSAEAVGNLKDDEFVVCFAVTDWQKIGFGTQYQINYTKISEVTILRLMFESDGDTFNLGVVSNKQTPDTNNDNKDDNDWDMDNHGNGDDPFGRFLEMLKEFLRKAWSVIKPILIALASVAVAILVVWLISKLVEIFKRPKVVIKDDKKKKHKE